jgi:hypothetical protein
MTLTESLFRAFRAQSRYFNSLQLGSPHPFPEESVGMAVVIRSFCYWPRLSRAERRGALEIWMSPVKGMYISRITKIAPETADAAAKRLATAVRLRGAKRPKLTKTKISRKTMTTSNGRENEAFDCSYINQRILPILTARFRP